MSRDCKTILSDPKIQKELFGDRKIPQSAINKLVDDIEQLKVLADKNPGGKIGNFNRRATEYIQEHKELLRIEKHHKVVNLRKAKANLEFATQEGLYNDPVEAGLSMLTSSNTLANGIRDSVEARAAAYENDWMNTIFGNLEDRGLMKAFVSGELDLEIEKGIFGLHNGYGAEGISAQAQEIAKILVVGNRQQWKDMRMADIAIRDLPGFVANQAHDPTLLVRAGKEKWISETMRILLDVDPIGMKKTFGVNAGDIGVMTKALGNMFDDIVRGKIGVDTAVKSGAQIADELVTTGYTRSVSDKLTQARFLRFHSPEANHQYRQLFGGNNLAETINAGIRNRARDVAMVARFGTDPEAGFRGHLDRLYRKYMDEGREDLAKKIKPDSKSADGYNSRLVNTFRTVSGAMAIPGEGVTLPFSMGSLDGANFAQVAKGARNIQALAKLGMSGIRAITNLSVEAVNIKNATGQNILESSWGTAFEFVRNLPPGEREKTARRLGLYLGDMSEAFMAHAALGQAEPGGFGSRALTRMLKWNGLQTMTDSMKVGHARMFMEAVGEYAARSYAEMPDQLKASFLAGGFDENDVNILLKSVTIDRGRTFVDPGALETMSVDVYKGEAKAKKMTPERYKRELQLKFKSMIIQGGNIGSTSAGAREQASFIYWQPGTAKGEAARFMYQFKGFIFQAYNISAQVLNSSPDVQALQRGQLMVNGINGSTTERLKGKNWASFLQLLAGTTVLGYVGQSLIDYANGREPGDPKSAATWVKAMQQSGTGGLYTDFVMQDFNQFKTSFAESLMGPMGGNVMDLQEVISGSLPGGSKSASESSQIMTKMIRNNIPFQNFVWTKWAVDYLHHDVIQETLTPGYSKKREAQMRAREQRKEGASR